MQVARGVPYEGAFVFSAFEQVKLPGVPDHADIYFAHPYVVLGELFLVMPIGFPPGGGWSGVYNSRCVDDLKSF